ncbi:MAG: hypothetical protein F6K63_29820 [Moorea sp. SIO1G6]|uniref:hypothetical protein n=1 Tax=Moorena sp. SIO1G6 TaxID=2607840 RepID=UPI0013C1CF44|nr:hypothetical protein [Moorena sp. SIO1G6]NET68368.1 hypothetical protein [Moorena sp. SIO1G6]
MDDELTQWASVLPPLEIGFSCWHAITVPALLELTNQTIGIFERFLVDNPDVKEALSKAQINYYDDDMFEESIGPAEDIFFLHQMALFLNYENSPFSQSLLRLCAHQSSLRVNLFLRTKQTHFINHKDSDICTGMDMELYRMAAFLLQNDVNGQWAPF